MWLLETERSLRRKALTTIVLISPAKMPSVHRSQWMLRRWAIAPHML
ncbi:MAG: hypothetical protein H7Z11_08460 [Verrucomicrobia bacterium]|nr:hypothetical protein [Leptolyngbya sp. ES-bin-22]